MRRSIPEHISKLAEAVEPYMEFNEKSGYVLRANAPLEIVEARKELKKWMSEHKK